MAQEFKPTNIIFPLKMTKEERDMLAQLGQSENGESNAVRRAIRLLMEERGIEIPEGLFVDRKAGNRLPKENRQQTHEALAV